MKGLKWIIIAVFTIGLNFVYVNDVFAEVLGPNLITNSNLEIAAGTGTSGWITNSWGNINASFSYEGTTNRFAKVTVNSITSGDAKWVPNSITTAPNTKYKISGKYLSTVTTQVVLALTDTSNKVSYIWLADLPASSVWKDFSIDYTTPANIKSLQVFHIINKIGQLSVDDISVQTVSADILPTPTPTPTPTPIPPNANLGPNLITNSNLEIASGTQPSGWITNFWGNINASFSYEGTTNRFAKVTVNSITSGDAKWVPNSITVSPNTKYKISGKYLSTVTTQFDLALTDTSNKVSYVWLADLPASSVWKDFSIDYTTPANIKSLQVLHIIDKIGQLSIDDISVQAITANIPPTPTPTPTPTPVPTPIPTNYNYISLTFDDAWRSVYTNALPLMNKYGFKSTQYLLTEVTTWSGYMDELMMQAFYNQGHEIASHTVSHPDLTTLTIPQITTELVDSKNWLQARFGPVTSFASPYGAYNNTTINEIAKYYTSHRTVDEGYNTKVGFNPLKLKVQNILQTTTTQEVDTWIQESKKQNAWLILVYHQIDGSGDFYGTTPAKLDAQLNVIKNSAVPVVTVRDGVTLLNK